MKVLKLYAPAIVLIVWAALSALGAGLTAIGLSVMAIAVFVHIRAEAQEAHND